MRRSLILRALINVWLLASCHSPRRETPAPQAPCSPPIAERADWQLIDRGIFTFKLPPYFRRLGNNGIDSWVESYGSADGREHVSFDYGQWSNDLHPDSESYAQYTACVDTIGGRPATVVTLRIRSAQWRKLNGSYVAAAAWRAPVYPSAHLTIWTQARDPRALEDLLAVLRSVKFPGRSAAPGPGR